MIALLDQLKRKGKIIVYGKKPKIFLTLSENKTKYGINEIEMRWNGRMKNRRKEIKTELRPHEKEIIKSMCTHIGVPCKEFNNLPYEELIDLVNDEKNINILINIFF